jgi:hypothetical protein
VNYALPERRLVVGRPTNPTSKTGCDMAEITDLVGTVQQQVLNAVEQSQQLAVGAVSAWSDAVTKALPATPKLPANAALPELRKQVDAGFDFAESLLGSQREFAAKVLDALAETSQTK